MRTNWHDCREMSPKDADRKENSGDTHQLSEFNNTYCSILSVNKVINIEQYMDKIAVSCKK